MEGKITALDVLLRHEMARRRKHVEDIPGFCADCRSRLTLTKNVHGKVIRITCEKCRVIKYEVED